MLLFPPNWTPTMPHLALPTLTAYLRQNRVAVIQRDLNVEVFDEILSRRYLNATLSRLRRMKGGRASPERVRWALQAGPRLAKRVAQAKAAIRSRAFYDGPIGLERMRTLLDCLEIASLPFYPAHLHLQGYEAAGPSDNSRFLLHGVRDERHNMFLDIYRRILLPDIVREQPHVVGISIPSMAQMLPGLTVAHLIKESGIDCHVTVGGPHISMLRAQLSDAPALFDLIDSAVVFDGELPLLQLAVAVAAGESLAAIPNLIYRDGSLATDSSDGHDNGSSSSPSPTSSESKVRIRVNARKEPEKIANLPLPDFDGLPLDRYLAPELALPLLTARGCYFGKCAFCNVGYGEPESFSQLRAQQLADQMLALHEKHGVRHIFFADEAVTPRNLRDLSKIMRQRPEELHWGGCVRFEKVISAQLLQEMQAGGCRMILFGLESASAAIIDHMIKGTQLPHMSRILQESAAAGIWNHTFFFFGFPGETIENAQETVNFLYDHKPYIHSAAMGTFLMERDSPAHKYPESFGVKRIIEDPTRDLAIYFDFEVQAGMSEQMAEMVHDRFLESLPPKRFAQFYISDVYRFLYASHLRERHLPHPPWLVPEARAVQ